MSETNFRAHDIEAARKNLPGDQRKLIASVRNDITIPYYTDVLRPQDETLVQRGGGKGLALYDEVERDLHAFAVLSKRKHELIARDWEIEPVTDGAADVKVAELLTDILAKLPFDQLCLDLLDATLKGYSVVEIVWARDGDRIIPSGFVAHDQRRFVFDLDWRPRLLTREAMLSGIALPDRKFIVHRFGTKGSDPYGRGLGSKLFWAVLFKREGIAYWLTFLEKYASPTPLAKVPIGMLPSEEQKILSALENLVQSGALTVPIGTDLDFLEAKRSTPASYEQWERYWDEQISEGVLGETLSTNIGKIGSMAAAETHSEQKSQIIDADADLLGDTLRGSLLAWLVDYNAPGSPVPTLRRPRPKNKGAEAEAREKEAKADEAERAALEKTLSLVDGLEERQAVAVLRETSTLARRMDDKTLKALIARPRAEPIVVGQPGQPNEPQTPGAVKPGEGEDDEESDPAFSIVRFAAPEPALLDRPHMADDVFEAFSAALDSALADWLIALQRRFEAVTSLPDPDGLSIASPDRFAEVMGDAVLFAQLVGRASVVAEAEEDGLTRADLFGETFAARPDPDIEFFGASFSRAMAYLRAKVPIPTRFWGEIEMAAHDTGFAVAGEVQRSVLEDIRGMILDAIDEGKGLKGFRKAFRSLIESGKWSGDERLATEAKRFGWRSRIIFWTNLSTSHAAGRRQQQKELTHVLPFWQYRHGATRTPKRARIRHLRLDGLTLPADDPVWDRIYAPNGWLCSCAIRAITRTAAERVDPNNREAPTEDEIHAAIDHEWLHAPGLGVEGSD